MRIDLKGLNTQETEQWIVEQGFEPFRAHQIRQWLFKKLVTSFDEMTNLPKNLRTLIEEKAVITLLECVKIQESNDGTKKYLFRLKDGHLIESVLIPEQNHYTCCISSQVGCAMDCRFCLTAKQGLKRNLSPSEIIEQVIHVKRSIPHQDQVRNIVFMGMGEPLANYEAVKKTTVNLMNDDGLNFSKRRITLSTCGLVPGIERLGHEMNIKLAVSLNAPDDKIRDGLMPVNRKYPLGNLLEACRTFPLHKGERITFEYVLIKGINDQDQHARNLAKLLKGIRSKINLIPLNPHKGTRMLPPSQSTVLRFQDILLKKHFTAIVRESRGSDILAACGQLGNEGMD